MLINGISNYNTATINRNTAANNNQNTTGTNFKEDLKKAEEKASETKENITMTEAEKELGVTTDPLTGKKYYPQPESLESLQKRREEMEKSVKEFKNPYSKETFLQLLVTQLKHQDPLEPMDNEQMLSQMAQFSTVEQLSNLNQAFIEFTKDFKMDDGKGNNVNVLLKELGRLNSNIEKISQNFGITENEDGTMTTDIEKFLDLYEKTYMNLFQKIGVLENEIKNLSLALNKKNI